MAAADSATPSADTLQSILTTAKLAASKAGELIMANKGAVAVAHTKDGDKDLVTLIDKQCEEVRIPQECLTAPRWLVEAMRSSMHCTGHQSYNFRCIS